MKEWYKFLESEGCHFNIIVSLDYVDSCKKRINSKALQKRVAEISANHDGSGNLGLDCKMHDENPNLFWSMNCNAGRYGLDFDPVKLDVMDKDKEVEYSTHNCFTPIQRFGLEKAFLIWARMIEANH